MLLREYIRGHLKQRYLLNHNDGGSKTLEHDDFSLNTIGTLGSVVSSFAATIYQGYPDAISTPYAGAAGMLLHINGKLKSSILLAVNFLSSPISKCSSSYEVSSRSSCICCVLYSKLNGINEHSQQIRNNVV